ncbi:MAG TPA: bacterioferritin [Acidimicrobiales bacterium]|nr:bacterioferritin [Acidimicrobiales bacterium]
MQGNPEIIELLNDILTAELTAINQYFVHAKMADNWGFERLADKIRAESIDEMHHAEKLIDRILYLEGAPNLQRLGALRVGETMVEALQLDLAVEHEAIPRFNAGIARAAELGDNGTRELLEDLLVSEEAHTDWLETQVDLLRQVGEQHYLAQQIRD